MGVKDRIGSILRQRKTWFIGVPVILVILLVGVPFAYTRMISTTNPGALSFSQLATTSATIRATSMPPDTSSAAASSTAAPVSSAAPEAAPPAAAPPPGAPPAPVAAPPPPAASPITGNWTVGSGTEVRYGIDDTLIGQTSRVVGRTSNVTGSAHIDGLTVTSAQVTVNMQSVRCNCIHDPMYNNMLQTPGFPTSSFVLTQPIVLPSTPTEGSVINVPVTGNFTIHGVTRSVSFTMEATMVSGRFAAKGTIPVELTDYDIRQPEEGPVARVHNADMELLIGFDKAG